jgi:tripartite-type tricarboxylate transporter receptor subunit TctC
MCERPRYLDIGSWRTGHFALYTMIVCRFLLAAILVAASISATPASAQDNFPTKPIKIVLPVPAGSALDIATRAIGDQLSSRWGQQVLIEARPGAGGLIAGQSVATAAPDGYTLVGGPASLFTILPAQKEKLPIDVNRDFTQIGMIVGSGVMFIAVSPKLGVATFPEFVALAKSKPGQIALGTNAAGTLPHFAGLVLEKKGNVPIIVVPYNQGGTMAAVADIMGGRVHGTIEGVFGLRGPLQSGDLKLIGQMAPQREPEFPDVPAVAETIPGVSAVGFMSLAAPAKTPEYIIRRLSEGLSQALDSPSVKQRFAEIGVPIRNLTPAQTEAFIENEQRIWWPLVKEFTPQ